MTSRKWLPEKFGLHGHSYGAYVSMIYAINQPERIEKLFLNSPFGAEARPDNDEEFKKSWYTFRNFNGEPDFPPRGEVDDAIR